MSAGTRQTTHLMVFQTGFVISVHFLHTYTSGSDMCISTLCRNLTRTPYITQSCDDSIHTQQEGACVIRRCGFYCHQAVQGVCTLSIKQHSDGMSATRRCDVRVFFGFFKCSQWVWRWRGLVIGEHGTACSLIAGWLLALRSSGTLGRCLSVLVCVFDFHPLWLCSRDSIESLEDNSNVIWPCS